MRFMENRRTMAHVRILIVDDHALVRDALGNRMQREPGFTVVGTAATADEAVGLASEHCPDVIVMNIDMPGLNCFDGARRITSAQPDVRLIFLSAYVTDNYIAQALAVGALGYLTKAEPTETIIAAIRDVAANKAYFSDEVRARIVVDSGETRLSLKGARTKASVLTPRETQILGYVARGLSTKKIARLLYVSERTVDNHRTNLMNKLAIHDRVDLTRFAIREGIATL